MKTLIFTLACFLCCHLLPAQPTWVLVDSAFAPLPAEVHVYKTTSLLDGKPNIAYYVSAPLSSKAIGFTTQIGSSKRFTPQEYYLQNQKPLVVVNGTFFSFADNRNLNMVMRNGRQVAYNLPTVKMAKDSTSYYYLTRSAIGISKKGKADIAWIFSDTSSRWPIAFTQTPSNATGPFADPSYSHLKMALPQAKTIKWKMQTAIGGGPMLLQNGQPFITRLEERMFVSGEHDKHPRTAMGYTADGRIIILAIEGRRPGIAEGATLLQEALMLQAIGCIEALNLDGGGSSCLLVNGKETIKPSDKEGQRPVPAVFMIVTKF
jgi:exopolysaccharide biosynthesis protein